MKQSSILKNISCHQVINSPIFPSVGITSMGTGGSLSLYFSKNFLNSSSNGGLFPQTTSKNKQVFQPTKSTTLLRSVCIPGCTGSSELYMLGLVLRCILPSCSVILASLMTLLWQLQCVPLFTVVFQLDFHSAEAERVQINADSHSNNSKWFAQLIEWRRIQGNSAGPSATPSCTQPTPGAWTPGGASTGSEKKREIMPRSWHFLRCAF